MPNIFGAIGRAITTPFPRRVRPEDLIMDRNGITGQELAVPPTPDYDYDLPDEDVDQFSSPEYAPPKIREGELHPDALISSDPNSFSNLRKTLVDEIRQPAPQHAKTPSGWRTALATIAGATAGGQAFAPLIAYGPKGLAQEREYQRYEDQLPRKLSLMNALTSAQNAETQEGYRRDQLANQKATAAQAALDRETTEADKFYSPTNSGTNISTKPLTTSSASQPTTIQSAPVGLDQTNAPIGNRMPTAIMPKATRELPPSIRSQFDPAGVSELPPPIQLEPMQLAGAQSSMTGKEGIPEGYFTVNTPKREAAQDLQRIQPRKSELVKQEYLAKTEPTPAFVKEYFESLGNAGGQGLPERMLPATIQGFATSIASNNRLTAEGLAREAQREADRQLRVQLAADAKESREMIAANALNVRKEIAGITAGSGGAGIPTVGLDGKPRAKTLEDAPAHLRSRIRQVLEYRTPNPPDSKSNVTSRQIRQWVADLDPTYDENEYKSRGRTVTDFGPSGKIGIQLTSADTALSHLDTLREAGEALRGGRFPALNEIAARFNLEAGSSPIATYNAIVEIISPELVKAVVATGAGGGVNDRAEMKTVIARNLAPEQREGSIGAIAKLLEARYKKQAFAYKQKMKKDMDRVLSPESQALLDRYVKAPTPSPVTGGKELNPQPPSEVIGAIPEGTSRLMKNGKTLFKRGGKIFEEEDDKE